jgi:hypothetical protein
MEDVFSVVRVETLGSKVGARVRVRVGPVLPPPKFVSEPLVLVDARRIAQRLRQRADHQQ